MNAYLGFLVILDQSNIKFQLSHQEQQLLDVVAMTKESGKILYVKDLLALERIASQATLHKILISLIEKRLLTLNVVPADGRLKEVRLANSAAKRYEDLNEAIERVSKH